jgi:hypothetical protein
MRLPGISRAATFFGGVDDERVVKSCEVKAVGGLQRMTTGKEIRATIDNELFKGLLLINGGGVVALLAMLSSLLIKARYPDLIRGTLWGILMMMGGLILAVVHQHYRRKCSLIYDHHHDQPPPGRLFGFQLWEPTKCVFSHVCMWGSLIAFGCAGIRVAVAGLCTVGQLHP